MWWWLAIGILASGVARAHVPTTYYLDPGEDWCSRLQGGLTGDVYVFLPGDYYGPCTIVGPAPDQYGERLFLRSWRFDQPTDPPSVLHHGTGSAVLSISGFDVSIEDLVFRDVPVAVNAIELEGEGHVVDAVLVDLIGGVAVQQTGDLTGLEVRESVFWMDANSAIRLGCTGCASADANVHDNLILGSNIGVVVSHGAWGLFRDDFVGGEVGLVLDSGAAVASTIEECFFSTEQDAIRLVGGAAVLRNTIAVGATALASVGPGDHRVLGNTLHGRAGEALRLEGWANGSGLELRDNALTGSLPSVSGALVDGNVACATDACGCWIDAEVGDYYPVPDGPLVGSGVALDFGDLLSDWCGAPRPEVPTVGALEANSRVGPGPVDLVGRAAFDCSLPPEPAPGGAPCDAVSTGTGTGTGTGGGTATGVATDSGQPRGRSPKTGCDCAVSAGPPSGLLALLALFWTRRRRHF